MCGEGIANGRQRDVHVVAIDVVPGVGVAGERQDLRVGDHRVPGFHERLGHGLPVGVYHLADPDRRRALLVPPALEVVRQGREVLLESRAALGFLDEDIAAPPPDLGLWKMHFFVGQMAKIPAARESP